MNNKIFDAAYTSLADYHETDLRGMSESALADLLIRDGTSITASWGMHNGLITNATDINGALAITMIQDMAKLRGIILVMVGTNDDQVGFVFAKLTSKEAGMKVVEEACALIVGGLRLFGITANRAKMVIGGIGAEINTNVAADLRGRVTCIKPAARNLHSAVNAVTNSDPGGARAAAMCSTDAAMKEGSDMMSAVAVGAVAAQEAIVACGVEVLANNLFRYQESLAIGAAPYTDYTARDGIEGTGFGKLGDSDPAPHLTGRPDINPHLAPFSMESRIAHCIFSRTLARNGGASENEAVLKGNICRSMALSTISKALVKPVATGWNKAESPIGVRVGPPSFRARSSMMRFVAKDPLLSQDTLANVAVTSVMNKGPNTLGNQTFSALVSESASMAASPFRFKDSISSRAAFGRYRGYMDSDKGTADVYVLSYAYLQADNTLRWYEASANLGEVLRACRSYDWSANPIEGDFPAVDVLAAILLRDVVNIDIVQKKLDSRDTKIVHGDIQPSTVTNRRNTHKATTLSVTEIARLLSPNAALAEAVDIEHARRAGPLSEMEWKHDLSDVSVTQKEDLMRMAATIGDVVKPVETGGYVVTAGKENCDAVVLAIDLATRNIGMGARLIVGDATEDWEAEAAIPMRKVDYSTNVSCLRLVKDFFDKAKDACVLVGNPSHLGIIPSGVKTEMAGTTIDAAKVADLVKGMRSVAANRSAVRLSARTVELISTRAKSGGAHFLKKGTTVKSLSHVHFIAGANEHPMHAVAGIERTRVAASKFSVVRDIYVLHVVTDLSPADRARCKLVVNYGGKTHWIKDHMKGCMVPGTEMLVRVHESAEFIVSLACYPPAYCLECVEGKSHVVIPIMNAEFDSPEIIRADIPTVSATTMDVSPAGNELARVMVRSLQGAASLRCSLLHELSCASAHSITYQWVSSMLSKEATTIETKPGLPTVLQRLARKYIGGDISINRRKKKATELVGALILHGWVRKAVTWSAESVRECLYYPREMDSIHNTLTAWLEGEEKGPLDISAPLAVGPVVADQSVFAVLDEAEDSSEYEDADESASEDEAGSELEVLMLMQAARNMVGSLETCMAAGGIDAVSGAREDEVKAELQLDSFGNPVKEIAKGGEAVVLLAGVDVDGVRAACEQYDGYYVETQMDISLPRYASCAKAVLATLKGLGESVLTMPGVASRICAIGTTGMMRDADTCLDFLPLVHRGDTHMMDAGVGLGMYDWYRRRWTEESKGREVSRTYVSVDRRAKYTTTADPSDIAIMHEKGFVAAAASTVTSVSNNMHSILSYAAYRTLTEKDTENPSWPAHSAVA